MPFTGRGPSNLYTGPIQFVVGGPPNIKTDVPRSSRGLFQTESIIELMYITFKEHSDLRRSIDQSQTLVESKEIRKQQTLVQ